MSETENEYESSASSCTVKITHLMVVLGFGVWFFFFFFLLSCSSIELRWLDEMWLWLTGRVPDRWWWAAALFPLRDKMGRGCKRTLVKMVGYLLHFQEELWNMQGWEPLECHKTYSHTRSSSLNTGKEHLKKKEECAVILYLLELWALYMIISTVFCRPDLRKIT